MEHIRSKDVLRTVTGRHIEIHVERDSLRGCKIRLRHQPRLVLHENSTVVLLSQGSWSDSDRDLAYGKFYVSLFKAVSYTHLTLPTNREV